MKRLSAKELAETLVSICFLFFVLGAMMCEMLMLSGIKTIAIHIGIPALLVRLILIFLIRKYPPEYIASKDKVKS